MQKNKVKSNCHLQKLVTDNSSFGSNEEETIVLSPRPSNLPPSRGDQQLVDDIFPRSQRPQSSGYANIAKKKEGWYKMNYKSDGLQSTSRSPTVNRKLRSSKINPKEMRYTLQTSPTSPHSTIERKNVKTSGDEKQCRENYRPDECRFEYLTPIEKEAKMRYERRMKQKKEKEQNKDNIFLF